MSTPVAKEVNMYTHACPRCSATVLGKRSLPHDKYVHPTPSMKLDTMSKYSRGEIRPPPTLFDTLRTMKVFCSDVQSIMIQRKY